ncbi:hypothetical protein HJFPF1_00142 [Paramyrothecium foliicola]|nr:hypothetical protein HJFPF1_00142 [Paramyrothecium foliicola]
MAARENIKASSEAHTAEAELRQRVAKPRESGGNMTPASRGLALKDRLTDQGADDHKTHAAPSTPGPSQQ